MKRLVYLVLLAAVGCGDGMIVDDCYVKPDDAPPIEWLSADWTAVNCNKGGGAGGNHIDFEIPGVHDYGAIGDPAPFLWDCTNAIRNQTTIDESGFATTYQIDIETEYVPIDPVTGKADGKLIDPRYLNQSHYGAFFAHVPVTVWWSSEAKLLEPEIGGYHTRHETWFRISQTPVAYTELGGLAPGQFYERYYAGYNANMGALGFDLTPSARHLTMGVPTEWRFELEPGQAYSFLHLVFMDASAGRGPDGKQVFNSDTDLHVDGAFRLRFEPHDPIECPAPDWRRGGRLH